MVPWRVPVNRAFKLLPRLFSFKQGIAADALRPVPNVGATPLSWRTRVADLSHLRVMGRQGSNIERFFTRGIDVACSDVVSLTTSSATPVSKGETFMLRVNEVQQSIDHRLDSWE